MSGVTPRHSLPRQVDALKCCQQGVSLSGTVSLNALPQIAALAVDGGEGEARVDWQFGTDEQARRVIHGSIQAEIALVCQRCLGPLPVTVNTSQALALVWEDEQAAQLPRTLDPVVMTGTEMDVYAVVEEEILLALPLVAQHAAGDCQPPGWQQEETSQVLEKRKSPFDVLAALKTGGTTTDSAD